jgi:aspartokinase
LVVQKFGGTSLADYAGFRASADVIEHYGGDGQVIVVLSAVKGVTDLLLAAIDQAVGGESGSQHMQEALQRERSIIAAMTVDGIATPLGSAFLQEQSELLTQRIEGVRMLGQCPDRSARILATGEGFCSRLMVDYLQHRRGCCLSDADALPLANDNWLIPRGH